MKKISIAAILFCCSVPSIATVPDGKTEKPFVIGNEVICLKEIQKQITPYLKSFEEEGERGGTLAQLSRDNGLHE